MIGSVAAMIQARQVSRVELVERSLRLLEASNPRIGAVVAVRADEALDESADQDRRAQRGEPGGPLSGIPILVKDLEDVAGMVTTQGSLLYEHSAPASRDGLVPGRLRAAGAIVIGKTNLPELAFEAYTANRLFGETRNP